MKSRAFVVVVILLFLISCPAFAKKDVAKEEKKEDSTAPKPEHRFKFGFGYNIFFPESKNQDHYGAKPDNSGSHDKLEWAYIADEALDIFDYHSPTGEISYEYVRWGLFGLELALGGYGNKVTNSFEIQGNEVESEIQVVVISLTMTPRLHLPFDAINIWIGPVIGSYTADVKWNMTSKYHGDKSHDIGHNAGTTYGFGGNLGFEIPINKLWGIGFEGRSVWAPINPNQYFPFRFNAGGNVIMLSIVVHP